MTSGQWSNGWGCRHMRLSWGSPRESARWGMEGIRYLKLLVELLSHSVGRSRMPSGCLSTDVYLGQGPGVGPGLRWWDYKFWLARKNPQVRQEKPWGFLLRTWSVEDAVVAKISICYEQECKSKIRSLMWYSFLDFCSEYSSEGKKFVPWPQKQEIEGYFSLTSGKDKQRHILLLLPGSGWVYTKNFFPPIFLHWGQATFPTLSVGLVYFIQWVTPSNN